MPEILVRGLSESLKTWVYEQSHRQLVTQNDFVLSLIREKRRAYGANPLPLFPDLAEERTVKVNGLPFAFIDLFAGIGGMRIGLEATGGHCVFSCEKDRFCQKTYKEWFGETPFGDITSLDYESIPDHDVLAAGFPCQPFSIAGVSKKKSLGRAHGFKDETQGTLFFYIKKIVEVKRPPVILLENVKNLRTHDKGKTWSVIRTSLESLGYLVFSDVVDASAWVPQHRERFFIVAFDTNVFGSTVRFRFPNTEHASGPVLQDILEESVPPPYTLSDTLWKYLQDYAAKHRARGNGFGYGLTSPDGIARTLSARYYKDGSEVLIPQGDGENPRRLTPKEAQRLMGFPDTLEIVVSDTQAYKQFGNAVVPAVVEAVARQILDVLVAHLRNRNGCLIKARSSSAERYAELAV